jgi:uncharacterized membrane protein YhhN
MVRWLILAFIFAALEMIAVSKNLQRWEYLAKSAALVGLFLWLYSSTGLQGNAFWFGLGILFSLVGDVLLISFERMLRSAWSRSFLHISFTSQASGGRLSQSPPGH